MEQSEQREKLLRWGKENMPVEINRPIKILGFFKDKSYKNLTNLIYKSINT